MPLNTFSSIACVILHVLHLSLLMMMPSYNITSYSQETDTFLSLLVNEVNLQSSVNSWDLSRKFTRIFRKHKKQWYGPSYGSLKLIVAKKGEANILISSFDMNGSQLPLHSTCALGAGCSSLRSA